MTRHLIPTLSISQCVSRKLYHSAIYSLTSVSSSIESSNKDEPFWKSLVWQWPNGDTENCWRNSRRNFIITRLNEYSVYICCSSSSIGRSCKMAWKLQIYSPKDLALANRLAVSAVFLTCLDLMTPTCWNPQYLCNLLTTLQIHGLIGFRMGIPQVGFSHTAPVPVYTVTHGPWRVRPIPYRSSHGV